MDKRNVAIVRATDIIPFDGIVRPISETPYLSKNTNTDFAFKMCDLLREEGIIPKPSFEFNPEQMEESQRILEEYIPYISTYNSMVLWAVNGLVPDDSENGFGNNTFSNKTCVIIDGLEEQLEMSDVVSIVPTDVALRGNVKLSDSAIILIEQDRYDSLTDEEKEKLSHLNVKLFTGDLREVVEDTLSETGRYIPERPLLSKSSGGFKESETSEELKKVLSDICTENDILQMYHFNLVMNSYGKIKGDLGKERENINIVMEYYQKQFFDFLIDRIGIDGRLAYHIEHYPHAAPYLKELCDKIKEYGLDNYKDLVTSYNQGLEQARDNGKLPTPQQIVDMERKNNPKWQDELDDEYDEYGRDDD